jgi:predicted RNase H-like HicB family nuclease
MAGYIRINYHARISRGVLQARRWYTVSVLDFPGVHTQGKSLREARFMVRDGLQLMAECYLKEGRTRPKPNPKATDEAAKRVEKICGNCSSSTVN